MTRFIVTVTKPYVKGQPRAVKGVKVVGPCPLDQSRFCTDVTGRHHSVLDQGPSAEAVRARWSETHYVVRVEEA